MKKIIVLLVAPIMLFGCKENSALSDVELTNPKLISPEIILSKHENERGRSNTSLVVYLNDKNNNSIDLLKGGVDLNNTPLGVQAEMCGAPYYTLGNIELVPKRKYIFNIRLADDRVYPCSIYSPEKTLEKMNVPEYHNMDSPLVVSWSNRNEDNTHYSLEIRNETLWEEIELSHQQAQKGKYVIPADLLYYINNEQNGDISVTLKSCTYGRVDPKFNGGSIKIMESICKQITLGKGDEPLGEQKGYQVYVPS